MEFSTCSKFRSRFVLEALVTDEPSRRALLPLRTNSSNHILIFVNYRDMPMYVFWGRFAKFQGQTSKVSFPAHMP